MSDEPSAESTEAPAPTSELPPPPPPPAPPSTPDVSVAPGWYPVDRQTNTQAYWDGEHWARRRRWRGTGWVEDSGDAAPAPASADGAEPGHSRYLPPSARPASAFPTSGYPASGYPPSMAGRQPMPTRPMVQKTNGSAIASLVLSILGLFGIGSLLGIIFGHRARREIRASGGYEGGEGLATAGIVIGWVTLVLFAVVLAFWIWAFTVIHSDVNSASSQQNKIDQCQADVRVVDVAVERLPRAEGFVPRPDGSVECRDLREQLRTSDHGRQRRRSVSERGSVDCGLRRRVRLHRQRLGRSAQHLRALLRREPRPRYQPNRLRGRRHWLIVLVPELSTGTVASVCSTTRFVAVP